MNRMIGSKIGFVFVLGTALAGMLTGCIGYVGGPRQQGAYAQPPPVYAETALFVQDDYVYYPDYQVYYSGRRHQYTYLEGRSWVSRPAPPRVSADVVFASPSVSMDFHDAPAAHHATVVKAYPKSWTPPGSSQGNKGGNKEGHKSDKKREGN